VRNVGTKQKLDNNTRESMSGTVNCELLSTTDSGNINADVGTAIEDTTDILLVNINMLCE
jgi:hypothetical protein